MADEIAGTSSGYWTTGEALSIIAYGDATALERLAPDEPDMWGKWGYSENSWTLGRRTNLLFYFRWVWARVRWRLTRCRRRGEWRRCPLPPLEPEGRAQVRRLMRKYREPARAVIKELEADIERARLAVADREKRLLDAERALRAAILEGTVVAYGRRGSAVTEHFFDGDHSEVPPTFFLHRYRRLTNGWATIGGAADIPMDEWLHWHASRESPDWGDLRFPKAALLARFTQPTGAPEGNEVYKTGAPGRPTSMQLVLLEYERRVSVREAHAKISAEAEHLAAWLRETHPKAPPARPKTIQNNINSSRHRDYASLLK